MKVAIMQPYFLPYIGYFQLIGAVDMFIVYDNIKYTKKGWINRNRMLLNDADAMFSLPLKKDSDALDVVHRYLAADFDREKMFNAWKGAYAKAPYFIQTIPLLERIVHNSEQNLFRFIHAAILETCAHLGIRTEIKISSAIPIDHALRSEEKVLALCKEVGADTYVNPIGGVELYQRNSFLVNGVKLNFIQSDPFEYAQFGKTFVPWLSIVDVLMFNALPDVQHQIKNGFQFI